MKVIIGQEIKNVCPNTRIALLQADVVNSETDEMLWTEIRRWKTEYATVMKWRG